MFVKGFGVDKLARRLYTWMKEYSPPPLPVQISTFSVLAGFLCMGIGVYLGLDALADSNLDFSNWLGVLPQAVGFFILNSKDLMVIGVCLALTGRAIRWYFERDARLLRNAALIVLVAWTRQILEAVSGILINPKVGYEALIFSIVIGILIGIASLLVIIVIHVSTRGFFKKTAGAQKEFEEG